MSSLAEVRKISKVKALPTKFNRLFALTRYLHDFDERMMDNEMWEEGGELEQLILGLAKLRLTMLGKSDLELGIDPEYTRPGVEAQLSMFAGLVESVESVNVGFGWHWGFDIALVPALFSLIETLANS
jgi:hypothetical protein